MSSRYVFITGASGLIGSQAVYFFAEKGFKIVGIDNDMRAYFFGQAASTSGISQHLKEKFKDKYIHYSVDIRNREKIEKIFKQYNFELIIHAAAQPSHDWAVKEPFTDFDINATGTLNLLENFKKYCPRAVFIFVSTNKVYGDRPNQFPFLELETRWELPKGNDFYKGIDENMSIDYCGHSLFGVSKTAADLLVQEYGRYFNLNTVVFRAGCVTGPYHRGVELHGFLAYLTQCILTGKKYTIFGYKGKQVRDNIHSFDLVNSFWHFYKNPRPAEVYNIGGGRYSNISINEAICFLEDALGKKAHIEYSQKHRKGDHIWYISDIEKFRSQYTKWNYTYDVYKIMEELCSGVRARQSS